MEYKHFKNPNWWEAYQLVICDSCLMASIPIDQSKLTVKSGVAGAYMNLDSSS